MKSNEDGAGGTRLLDHDPAGLLQAAQDGDQRAWDELVALHGPSIRAVARRHRLNAANQEEVVQRTWLRLVEHVASVREPAALRGWLTTVARHECLRVLRASERELPFEDPLPHETPDTSCVEDELFEALRKQALHAALDGLPEHQRRVLRSLLAEPELNYQQLSVRLGVPRGSIGPTRGRGLARLRRDPYLRSAVDGHVDRRTPTPPSEDLF
jgi:RNA polymerase sigma factor (sigma-70 family)